MTITGMSFIVAQSNYRPFDTHSLDVVIPPQDANYVNAMMIEWDIVMAVQPADQDALPSSTHVAILPYNSLQGESKTVQGDTSSRSQTLDSGPM